MGAYCEHCDYNLAGLLDPGGEITCPECGGRAKGRWLPRRVRVGLAVFAAISPMLLGVAVGAAADVLRSVHGGGWSLFELAFMVLGMAGVLLPPAAAWWLWSKSARRRLDAIDIACLLPVGWILNAYCIIAGALMIA